MKPTLLSFALILPLVTSLCAQEAQNPKGAANSGAASSSVASSAMSQEELEAKFIETMTNATMSGRWTALKDGVLGEEKEDKYTIVGVKKVSGSDWVISARVQYGNRDVVAPIPVQMKWAGDAAVIVVNDLAMPTGGKFSARVLVFNNTYAGTWSGGDHGGLLNGIIKKTDSATKAPEAK